MSGVFASVFAHTVHITKEEAKEISNIMVSNYKKIDAFVLNELVLKYLARNEFPGRVQVLPGIFDEYFVVIALKEKSSLRKPINKALLKLMKTEKWTELLNRYTQ